MRNIWMMYANLLSANVNFSNFLLAGFFRIYAPFYRELSTPVAHRNELEADLDSLQYINDEDLLQTIETVIVTKIYLDQQYWPKLEKLIKEQKDNTLQPYSNLEDILQRGLTTKNTKRWLDSLYRDESYKIKAIPSLRARMYNIGRSRIRIPEKITQTAAHTFLDSDYTNIVNGVNRLWMQRTSRNLSKMPYKTHGTKASIAKNLSTHFTSNVFQ